MFARRRFEFPHLSLSDDDGNHVGIVQLRARLVARQLIRRTGHCGHPRWRQWWIPARVLRTWVFEPTPADTQLLLDHRGTACLKATPVRIKLDSVELALPHTIRVTSVEATGRDINGLVVLDDDGGVTA